MMENKLQFSGIYPKSVFRVSGFSRKMGFSDKFSHGFSSFFANFFGIFDDLHSSTLKNHQIYQKFDKKLRKALFDLP